MCFLSFYRFVGPVDHSLELSQSYIAEQTHAVTPRQQRLNLLTGFEDVCSCMNDKPRACYVDGRTRIHLRHRKTTFSTINNATIRRYSAVMNRIYVWFRRDGIITLIPCIWKLRRQSSGALSLQVESIISLWYFNGPANHIGYREILFCECFHLHTQGSFSYRNIGNFTFFRGKFLFQDPVQCLPLKSGQRHEMS